jgi:hypothetical protein
MLCELIMLPETPQTQDQDPSHRGLGTESQIIVCSNSTDSAHYYQAARIDLIAFDSPFISDPGEDLGFTPEPEPEPSFEVTWKVLEKTNARGWCDSSMDVALRRLQGQDMRLKVIPVDQPPFEGALSHGSYMPCFLTSDPSTISLRRPEGLNFVGTA